MRAEPLNIMSNPIRLLTISATGIMGGAERSFYELIMALPRESVDVHACLPAPSELGTLLSQSNIPVHPMAFKSLRRTKNPLAFARQLKALHQTSRQLSALCTELKIDLMHANTDSAAVVAWRASRICGTPFIWHCRDLRPLHGLARIIAGKSCMAVVAISGAVEKHLIAQGVNPVKIKRIDNGIDLSRFHALERRAEMRVRVRHELSVPPDCQIILSVGAYVPWKKHELFLNTLAQLRESYPGKIGLLAGSDQFGQNAAYTESLHQLARELKLDETALRFLHQRNDIPDLMAASDLLVSCSENEPFGRVLAEAGAAGLPVVTTASGAKAEIVADNGTGLVVEADAGLLAAACERLLCNDALRSKMGLRARARIEGLFDVRRTAAEFVDLLGEIKANR